MIKGRKLHGGFTIIETLIVLAVTGTIFLIAVTTISGRQAKTEFQIGINNSQQQVQQLINETISGYFPHSANYTCNGTTKSIGSNYGCVFLGKVLLFGVQQGTGVTVYSLTGDQTATDIAGSSAAPLPSDTVVRDTLPNGLYVTSMSYVSTTSSLHQQTAGVAFVAGDSSGTLDQSSLGGSQQFSLYAVNGTKVNNTTENAMVNAISPPSNKLDHAKQVQICIASGGTDQSGLITVGTNNVGISGGLSVNLRIYAGTTCT
jgi:type II secretory pathway pseudopilin PulG